MSELQRQKSFVLSKVALEKAKSKCGFSTQKAIAEATQSQDGLMTLSKSSVERAFQGKQITWKTLIALSDVLQEEPETLLEQSFDEIAEHGKSPEQVESVSIFKTYQRSFKVTLTLAGLLFLIFIFFVSPFNLFDIADKKPTHQSLNQVSESEIAGSVSLGELRYGKYRIIILIEPDLLLLGQALKEALSDFGSINVVIASVAQNQDMSYDEAFKRWGMNGLIRINRQSGKVFDSYSLSWQSDKQNFIFAHDILPQSNIEKEFFKASFRGLSEALTTFINDAISGSQKVAVRYDAEYLSKVLSSADTLFFSNDPKQFESLLSQLSDEALEARLSSHNDPLVLSIQCQTYVMQYWATESTETLTNAEEKCLLASEQAPNALFSNIALSRLLLTTGRADEALAIVKKLLASHPNSPQLYLIASEASAETNSEFKQALEYAQRSVALEPRYWRAHNQLATLYLQLGDIEKASQQLSESNQIFPQEIVAANLGTMQACLAQYDKAIATYKGLIENFENNYIGFENLGNIHFLQGDYKTALEHKLISLEKLPDSEIHQMWGSTALIYEYIEDIEWALAFYQRAHGLVQKDLLLTPDSSGLLVYEFYYFMKEQKLMETFSISHQIRLRYKALLQRESDLGIAEKAKLAWVAGVVEDNKTKNALKEQISNTCPMYKDVPELD